MSYWCQFLYFKNWKSFFNILADLSQVVIAVIAFWALTTWKRELKGTDKYIIAKKLLKGAEKVQQVIQKSVRNPGLHPAEVNKDKDDYNWQYYVYQKRLKEMYEYKIKNFDEYAFEAKILLSEKTKEIISRFNEKIDELRIFVYHGYGMLTGVEGQDKELFEKHGDEIFKNRKLLWNTELEDDSYSKELESIVVELVRELDQYLR